MSIATPIKQQSSVELVDCGIVGVREAKVVSSDTGSLEWDRWSRLRKASQSILELSRPIGEVILDVGGFDGALALFLPQYRIWVVDPATTGATGDVLPFGDRHFPVVVSVDALEHVERSNREKFLREMVRVCQTTLLINYPAARSMDAQRAVLALTQNRFIAEHVNFVLPSSEETITQLKQTDSSLMITLDSFTSIAAWMPWFVLLQKDRSSAMALSTILKQNHSLSNQAPFLYDLLICKRN